MATTSTENIAIVYSHGGGPEVLKLTRRAVPEPGPGEVLVRVHVSGVNPTDWKTRAGGGQSGAPGAECVPNQDGAGVIDAVGAGVDPGREGQRVWVWEAAWQRTEGTAQQYLVIPARQAVPLPEGASFDLGASLGIPALTAHRALTLAADGPSRLAPGALAGRRVLVAGGAGAVGNAAIQLARWAGAQVAATVSGEQKAQLARAAGAAHVVNYRDADAAAQIRAVFPGGAQLIVQVAPAANAALDVAVAAPGATVAFYANEGGDRLELGVRDLMFANLAWHGLLVYTVTAEQKDGAVADVSAAVAAGALRVGADGGLPLHRFPLERAGEAHAAVEGGAVGKVLIDLP
ncbi:NADPH:quinone reductase [Actinocrinis puniceicyclus]|uniref:NADPH:quinone reductase n=1 Tax=Actinocrinis puniceicyclus TaxID=977794 RepID=A0A8J7WMM1_9ACTN|nr:NADPH:quinone reductase [Actinocrinis puniceicyclus]MBS2965171.1 NADPH:quinone reductase [Actinocrinis puniceicyclus]